MTSGEAAGRETTAGEVGVITCPGCGVETEERMPVDACVVRWACPSCGAELRPVRGDCCVFCSYGSRPCPPERASDSC